MNLADLRPFLEGKTIRIIKYSGEIVIIPGVGRIDWMSNGILVKIWFAGASSGPQWLADRYINGVKQMIVGRS